MIAEAEKTAPEPGIYQGVPFPEYQSWPLMNASTLVHGLTSMEHLKLAIDGGMKKDSDALNFGRALHSRLLEPDLFSLAYRVAEPCHAIIKSKNSPRKGERCGATGIAYGEIGWVCGTHRTDEELPENVVSAAEQKHIEAIVAKVKRHPVIKLIRQHGGTETCVVWNALTGTPLETPCKARLDKWIPGGKCPPTIIDVKKVAMGRGTRDAFERAIVDYSYHIKAAFYVDAIAQQTETVPVFIWIVVEDAPPYSVAVFRCDDATMTAGRREYKRLLMEYQRCLRDGVWPGYSQDIDPIDAPGWYLKRFDREEIEA